MRCLMSVFGSVAAVLRRHFVQFPILGIVGLIAVSVGLAVVNSGFGDESDNSDSTKSSASPASEPTKVPKQPNREKNDRIVGDDSVRHHAALGVLLSKSADGVTVVGVIPGSPAERAGMHLGDEIRFVDDRRIRTTQELTDEIREFKPGTQVEVTIRRNGRRQIVTASLASAESTFGNDAGLLANPGPVANSNTQIPNHGQPRDPQQVLNQRIRSLERQIYRMQQRINALQSSGNSNEAANSDDWWGRVRRGETDNDPALFQ